MSTQQPIPFTVLGGYLGSGKTTLLNHALRQSDDHCLAVIVNDFGSISIDASLIHSRVGDAVTLVNGCICCSISAGFAEALTALSRRSPPPEHVIIESSGVADPVKVGYFGSLPPYRLDAVVVLADAETVRQRSTDKYVGSLVRRQLQGADLIVLNKTDLVTAPQQASLRIWLREQVPNARIVATTYGAVPLAVALGLHRNAGGPTGDHDHHRHDHGDDYASWSVAFDTPMREAAFRSAISGWPKTILRAKGIVCLAEDPLHRHVFQMVGRRWSLTADRTWGSDPPRSELVLMGLAGQLDGETLLATLVTAKLEA